jgi:hypothetical protein
MKTTLLILFIGLGSLAFCQDENQFESKSIIVLSTTKNYTKALRLAQRYANDFQTPMNLRSMVADNENGLTSSALCGCGEQHGYIPRGRSDDGLYISIELSSGYSELAKNEKYMIVAFSGDPQSALDQFGSIKSQHKKATIEPIKVYQGCMH